MVMSHGFMSKRNPWDFPYSRDFAGPDIKCKKTDCVANYGGTCSCLALVEINAQGKCAGYRKGENGKTD